MLFVFFIDILQLCLAVLSSERDILILPGQKAETAPALKAITHVEERETGKLSIFYQCRIEAQRDKDVNWWKIVVKSLLD